MSTPKTSAGLPRHPIQALAFLRRFISGEQLEHAVVTRKGKTTLGQWLDKLLKDLPKTDLIPLPIQGDEPVPFFARCGNFSMVVEKVETLAPQFIVLHGRVIEGLYFNDSGQSGPGEAVRIGPITEHVKRITVQKP